VSAGVGSRGRLDKREAILDAAFRVFAEHGYERASVDAIAAEAGVAKPTIYNHLGGKENLFREVMIATVTRFNARTLATLDEFPAKPADLRAALVEVGTKLGSCVIDQQSTAMSRLLAAESARFPDLFDAMRATGHYRVRDALAGRLARLAHAGRLEVPDPDLAAYQFMTMIVGDLPLLAVMTTKPISRTVLRRTVADGVDTFLRAYSGGPGR
jgi:AcrR family transcriptional regulator